MRSQSAKMQNIRTVIIREERERKTSREERPNWDVGSPLNHVRVQCEYMRVMLGSPLTRRAKVQRLLMVRSAAFLAVHHCSAFTSCPVRTEPAAVATSDTTTRRCCNAQCDTCNRCFLSTQGRNRHRCSTHCHRPTARERDQFPHMCTCSRRFRLVSLLERHRVACSFSLSAAPSGPT